MLYIQIHSILYKNKIKQNKIKLYVIYRNIFNFI